MRALAAAGLVALLLPAAAAAHVTARPPFLTAREQTVLTFDTPNERREVQMTGLVLVAPGDVELLAGAAPGWTAVVRGDTLTFSGGTLAPGRTGAFRATVRAVRAGTSTFRAEQRFADGGAVRWETALGVLPASGVDAPHQRLGRAAVAAAAGVAVIAASLAALWRLRRRPLGRR